VSGSGNSNRKQKVLSTSTQYSHTISTSYSLLAAALSGVVGLLHRVTSLESNMPSSEDNILIKNIWSVN